MKSLCGFLVLISLASAHAECAAMPDKQVLTTVLRHFASRADTMSMHEDGITLVRPRTAEWTDETLGLYTLHRGDDACPIGQALYDRLVVRNTATLPVAALSSSSPRWRLLQSQDEIDGRPLRLDRSATSEPIKTLVHLSRPAYSAGGDTAFVMFFFQRSMHLAIAQYLVGRVGNEWTVTCSQLRFYP